MVRARRAREHRPRLGLAEDRALPELPAAGIPAGVPALPGPLAPGRGQVASAARAELRGKGVIAARIRELGQAWVDVGELGRHEVRLRHLEELGGEVGPVAGGAGEVVAMRPELRLLMLVGE